MYMGFFGKEDFLALVLETLIGQNGGTYVCRDGEGRRLMVIFSS